MADSLITAVKVYYNDETVSSFELYLSDGRIIEFTVNSEEVKCYTDGITEKSLNTLIGKVYVCSNIFQITKITEDNEDEYRDIVEIVKVKDIDEIIMLKEYQILSTDGFFNFKLLYATNGYYDASVVLTTAKLDNLTLPKKSLIVVVGLPACGKTTFSNTFKKYKIYDDEQLLDFTNIYQIYNDLLNGEKVLLCSALFCDVKFYENIIKKLFVNEDCILTYAFDSNVEQSVHNLSNRGYDESIFNSIITLSKRYNPDDRTYINVRKLLTYSIF